MRRLIAWGNQLSIQKFTILSFIPVLFFRLLFLITYPLANITTQGGDTGLYFNNILEGKASLVNATGYSFLMGLIWRIEPVKHKLLNHPLEFTYLILLQQHAIDLVALLVFFVTLYLIFNRWTAMISTWIYGMDVIWGVSNTSASNPQWLQAVFLVISLAAAYRAWSIKTNNPLPSWLPVKLNTVVFRKTFWYSISMIAFVWCCLSKFSVAVMGIFYIVFFFAESLKFWKKLFIYGIAGILALANLLGFIYFFHYPQTGTTQLTADASWVIMGKLDAYCQDKFETNYGINTRRWLALSAVLPPDYQFAGPGMFSNINAVPEEIRAPYRQRYSYLLSASDAEVTSVFRENSLPKSYKRYLTSIPISYYIGLEESDTLGWQVYFEVIRTDPVNYIVDTLGHVWGSFYNPTRPPMLAISPLENIGIKIEEELPLGFIKVQYGNSDIYRATSPYLWKPGVQLFAFLNHPLIPFWVVSLICWFGWISALFEIISSHQFKAKTVTPLLLGLLTLEFMFSSWFIMFFRSAEIRVILPLVCALIGISITVFLPELFQFCYTKGNQVLRERK